MDIKRYEAVGNKLLENMFGDVVLYGDHLATMKEKEETISNMLKDMEEKDALMEEMGREIAALKQIIQNKTASKEKPL